MPDGRYKFPTMNDVESGAAPLDKQQLLADMNRLHNAPVCLNGQLVELVNLLAPPPPIVTFIDTEYNTSPEARWGFLFKDGHTEYAVIKQINVITSAEPRIEIITEGPPERAPQ